MEHITQSRNRQCGDEKPPPAFNINRQARQARRQPTSRGARKPAHPPRLYESTSLRILKWLMTMADMEGVGLNREQLVTAGAQRRKRHSGC